MSDMDSGRSRKGGGRKAKGKAPEYDTPPNGKRKRGGQVSLTPSIAGDDDDDDRTAVCSYSPSPG